VRETAEESERAARERGSETRSREIEGQSEREVERGSTSARERRLSLSVTSLPLALSQGFDYLSFLLRIYFHLFPYSSFKFYDYNE
jgi:hypothetical protein